MISQVLHVLLFHESFTFALNGDKTRPGIFSLLLALGISNEVVFAGVVLSNLVFLGVGVCLISLFQINLAALHVYGFLSQIISCWVSDDTAAATGLGLPLGADNCGNKCRRAGFLTFFLNSVIIILFSALTDQVYCSSQNQSLKSC